ncbi:MAG: hypothetical protein AAGJ35_05755, partial [Myxococcota bacterium]
QVHSVQKVIVHLQDAPIQKRTPPGYKPPPIKQHVSFLQDQKGRLLPTRFLSLFGQVSKTLFHKTLDLDPKLFSALQRIVELSLQCELNNEASTRNLLDLLEERQTTSSYVRQQGAVSPQPSTQSTEIIPDKSTESEDDVALPEQLPPTTTHSS